MSEMMKLFNVPAEFVTRKHTEKDVLPLFRNEFMRDRDRLMYATAFRRLAGKTQIYTVGSDDHKKNRLTHSLEVAQIARTIARALGLNEDLTEAIALGHDFGHTPFGHAGEEMPGKEDRLFRERQKRNGSAVRCVDRDPESYHGCSAQ